MANQQSNQHQHAQLLASFATEHFAQKPISPVTEASEVGPAVDDSFRTDKSASQSDSCQEPVETTTIASMSTHSVINLLTQPSLPAVEQPSASSSPFNLRKNLKKRKIDHDEPEHHEEYKLIRSKERVNSKSFDMRRPVRPIDRQKMRPWLKNLLDTGSVFGLTWIQRDEGSFQISWRHASRLGWNLETDGDVFERWARHTGIFKDGDEPEPKRWKANFRCALHSLPDVQELTSPSDRKGRNASRTYRFLRPNEIQQPVKRKQRYNIQIPYSVYDRPQSEDSGSPQADSDRNTDEEAVVPDEVQAFPFCDHDYAIRAERHENDDQTTAEVLAKHNSGYVLIKSKEANEFEFRLTPPQSSALQTPNTKKASPPAKASSSPKKGKGSKRKAGSVSSPLAKGNSKEGQKSGPSKKEVKQVKKMKLSEEKDPSPATKVSLKTLLSGRNSPAKRAKAAQESQAARKTAKGKKVVGAAVKASSRKEKVDAEGDAPALPQGLAALCQAASSIELWENLKSGSDTVPFNTSSQAVSKQPATQPSMTAPLPSTAAPVVQPSSTLSSMLSVAAPVILTTHPIGAADRVAGTTLAPIPVLNSVLPVPAPSTVSSQVQLNMVQKYLNTLSPKPTVTASPSPVTLIHVPALSSAITSQPAMTLLPETCSNQLGAPSSNNTVVLVNSSAHSSVPVTAQPEGTSMLKHLLRLTNPSVSIATSTTSPSPLSTTPISVIPATPQARFPLVVSAKQFNAASSVTGKSNPLSGIIEDKSLFVGTGTDHIAQVSSFSKISQSVNEVGLSQEKIELQTDIKSFGSGCEGVGKACVKLEPLQGGQTAPSGSVTAASLSTHMTAQQTPTASSVPQITLCLPQTVAGQQSQQAAGSTTQTMTLTLPPAAVSALQGQATSPATLTQSMDLLQFLNLFASGNGQVIIKTEGSVANDVAAMGTAYSEAKEGIASQQHEGDAPKFLVIDNACQPPAALGSVSGGNQLETAVGQAVQGMVIPPLSVAGGSSVLSSLHGASVVSKSEGSSVLPLTKNSVKVSQDPAGLVPSSVVASTHSAETTNIELSVNEADISTLTDDQQGTDSFVVDDMLI